MIVTRFRSKIEHLSLSERSPAHKVVIIVDHPTLYAIERERRNNLALLMLTLHSLS
jgi:hypothetical protein